MTDCTAKFKEILTECFCYIDKNNRYNISQTGLGFFRSIFRFENSYNCANSHKLVLHNFRNTSYGQFKFAFAKLINPLMVSNFKLKARITKPQH